MHDIGHLIITLQQKAKDEGRLRFIRTHDDQVMFLVVDVIRNPADWNQYSGDKLKPYVEAGRELHSGVVRSPLARQIRRTALRSLHDYDLFLWAIDTSGYTPLLLRTALTIHYGRLQQSDLGSDGHLVLVDIKKAVGAAPKDVAQTAQLLAMGFSSQKIGEMLGENGSKRVHRSLGWLARRLQNDLHHRKRGSRA